MQYKQDIDAQVEEKRNMRFIEATKLNPKEQAMNKHLLAELDDKYVPNGVGGSLSPAHTNKGTLALIWLIIYLLS